MFYEQHIHKLCPYLLFSFSPVNLISIKVFPQVYTLLNATFLYFIGLWRVFYKLDCENYTLYKDKFQVFMHKTVARADKTMPIYFIWLLQVLFITKFHCTRLISIVVSCFMKNTLLIYVPIYSCFLSVNLTLIIAFYNLTNISLILPSTKCFLFVFYWSVGVRLCYYILYDYIIRFQG